MFIFYYLLLGYCYLCFFLNSSSVVQFYNPPSPTERKTHLLTSKLWERLQTMFYTQNNSRMSSLIKSPNYLPPILMRISFIPYYSFWYYYYYYCYYFNIVFWKRKDMHTVFRSLSILLSPSNWLMNMLNVLIPIGLLTWANFSPVYAFFHYYYLFMCSRVINSCLGGAKCSLY